MGDVNGPIDLMDVANKPKLGMNLHLHVSDSTNEMRNRGPPRHSSVA